MQKILVSTVLLGSPLQEAALEIMEYHMLKGDDVTYLACDGQLEKCHAGIHISCDICRKRREIGFSLLPEMPKLARFDLVPPLPPQDYRFDSIEQLKELNIDGINIGWGIFSILLDLSGSDKPDVCQPHWAPFIQGLINAARLAIPNYKKLCEELKPDLAYIYNGRFPLDSLFIQILKEFKINFFTLDLSFNPNQYKLIFNDLTQKEAPVKAACEHYYKQIGAQAAFFQASQCFSIQRNGGPYSDRNYISNQQAGSLPENFDKNKINVTLFNSTTLEYLGVPDYPPMCGFYKSEEEAVRLVAESFQDYPEYHFYLRLHPNLARLNTNQARDLLAMIGKYPNLAIIPPDASVDSYALMEASNIVMVFHSTMGAEASFWGKPVIVLGQAHYKNLGGFYLPTSHQELVKLIKSRPVPQQPIGATKYGAWLINGNIDFHDYHSTASLEGIYKGVNINQAANLAVGKKDYKKMEDCLSYYVPQIQSQGKENITQTSGVLKNAYRFIKPIDYNGHIKRIIKKVIGHGNG